MLTCPLDWPSVSLATDSSVYLNANLPVEKCTLKLQLHFSMEPLTVLSHTRDLSLCWWCVLTSVFFWGQEFSTANGQRTLVDKCWATQGQLRSTFISPWHLLEQTLGLTTCQSSSPDIIALKICQNLCPKIKRYRLAEWCWQNETSRSVASRCVPTIVAGIQTNVKPISREVQNHLLGTAKWRKLVSVVPVATRSGSWHCGVRVALICTMQRDPVWKTLSSLFVFLFATCGVFLTFDLERDTLGARNFRKNKSREKTCASSWLSFVAERHTICINCWFCVGSLV